VTLTDGLRTAERRYDLTVLQAVGDDSLLDLGPPLPPSIYAQRSVISDDGAFLLYVTGENGTGRGTPWIVDLLGRSNQFAPIVPNLPAGGGVELLLLQ
jgi:hypothetical protein